MPIWLRQAAPRALVNYIVWAQYVLLRCVCPVNLNVPCASLSVGNEPQLLAHGHSVV